MLELEHMLTLCSTEKDMITQDTVDILIENLCNIFVFLLKLCTSSENFFRYFYIFCPMYVCNVFQRQS
jgi:hypothetical protein